MLGAGAQLELPLRFSRRVGAVSVAHAGVGDRRLGQLAELGSEQGRIDLACPLKGFDIDRDVDERIETAHRADVARFGSESTPGLWPGC